MALKPARKSSARHTKPGGSIPEKTMRDALMLELASTIEAPDPTDGGRVKQFRKARLIAIAMVNAAIKGDVAAGKLVFDRSDGKLAQPIIGDPDAPIVQQVTHQEIPAAAAEVVNYDALDADELARAHAQRTATARNETKH